MNITNHLVRVCLLFGHRKKALKLIAYMLAIIQPVNHPYAERVIEQLKRIQFFV